jgi:hypothetical protein
MAPSGHSQDYLHILTSCHWTLGCSVPSVLHFDADHNVLRQSFQGRLTDTALVEGYYQAGKYVVRHPPSGTVTDFSDVTSIEVSSHTVRTLAATPPKLPVGCARVFVTPQNALYGVARMFQILVERNRPDLHIVRTLDEAYRFLGITSADFSPIDPEDFVEDQSA